MQNVFQFYFGGSFILSKTRRPPGPRVIVICISAKRLLRYFSGAYSGILWYLIGLECYNLFSETRWPDPGVSFFKWQNVHNITAQHLKLNDKFVKVKIFIKMGARNTDNGKKREPWWTLIKKYLPFDFFQLMNIIL